MENILDIFKAEQPDAYETFKELLSDEEITKSLEEGHIKSDAVEKALKDDLEKGKASEEEDKKKKAGDEEDEEFLKAELDKKQQELKDLQAKLEKCGSGVEKSLDSKETNDVIEKAITEKVTEYKEEFEKSLDSLNDVIKGLQDEIENLKNQTPTPKSVQGFSVIEKGGKLEDEEGKRVLHVHKQRGEVLEVLQKSLDTAEDGMKEKIEKSILDYGTAGILPDQETTAYLKEKLNVRLVKG